MISTTHSVEFDVNSARVSMDDFVVDSAIRRLRAIDCQELLNVECDFHSGILLLRGRVSSYYYKQLAQELVRNLSDVTVIQNSVEVIRGLGMTAYSNGDR